MPDYPEQLETPIGEFEHDHSVFSIGSTWVSMHHYKRMMPPIIEGAPSIEYSASTPDEGIADFQVFSKWIADWWLDIHANFNTIIMKACPLLQADLDDIWARNFNEPTPLAEPLLRSMTLYLMQVGGHDGTASLWFNDSDQAQVLGGRDVMLEVDREMAVVSIRHDG